MQKVIILTDRLNSYKKGQILTYGTANANLNIVIENLINNGEAEFIVAKEEKGEATAELKKEAPKKVIKKSKK